MTILMDQLSASQGGKEITANENFRAVTSAAAGGRKGASTTGLTLVLYGGVFLVDGTPTEQSNQSFTLAASDTTYIYRNRDGTLTQTTTAPTNWPGPLINGAEAVCDATTDDESITGFNDWRLGMGAQGEIGGAPISIRYVFSTTTADADPGDGKLRLDNATQNAATTIRADLLDEYGEDWTDVLATFDDSTSTVKGHIRLQHAYDPTKWLIFSVSALATPTGYRNITVTNIDASDASPFANNDLVLLAFQRTGDKGQTGDAGATGFPYIYSSTTSSGDPGSGTLRFNNATISSVTALYISETDGESRDLAAEIAQWDDPTSAVRAKVRVHKVSDPATFAIFSVTGANTDNGSWVTVVLTHVTSGGSFSDADDVAVLVLRTGDKGDTGAQGSADAIVGASGTGGAIIPGLVGSPDVRVAGTNDDEFDTTDTSDPMTGWTTLGTPTAHDINNTVKSHYYLQKSAASGDVAYGIYKACPTIPFTMTAKLAAANITANFNSAGIFVAEAAPGKLLTFAMVHNSSAFGTAPNIGAHVDLWTNRTTYGSNVTTKQGPDAPIYLRIVVTSSSNIAFYYSKDGMVWRLLQSGYNPSFTVGAVGLHVNANNASAGVEALYDWVRFT